MRRALFWIVVVSSLFIDSTSAHAQNPVFNANVRVRGELWSWFETPQADDSYMFAGALARLALSQQKPAFGWRVELAAPLLVGLPENAIAPAPRGQLGLGAAYFAANDSAENTAGLFLKQAFVRVAGSGLSARAGRFEFVDGTEVMPASPTLQALKRDRIAHRLIGNFGFSHVQRSFDGIHAAWDGAPFNVTLAAFRPTRGVFDVNGWQNLDVNVAYGALTRTSAAKADGADMRIFAIHYNDNRDVLDAEVQTFGAHYVRAMGSVDVLVWGALQTGDWSGQDHRANAFALEAGVQPALRWRPWLRAGYNRSSGDDDAADNEHGTFFQVLPTPRIYARMPFYNAMNMTDAFATLILRPSTRVTLRADAHRLNLTESADRWYAGGGAFEKETPGYAARPSQGSTDLAAVFDLSAELRLGTQLTATGYLALAKGGDIITRTYTDDQAHFGYIELEWRR